MLKIASYVADRRYLAFMRRLREENFPPSSDWSLRLRLLDVAERTAARVEMRLTPKAPPVESPDTLNEAIRRLKYGS